MIKVFGIKNCNTMKKTFDFFHERNVVFEFVDYKKTPPTEGFLKEVEKAIGLDVMINKSGTTFKKLSDEQKKLLNQKETAYGLISKNSSMIKRPLIQFSENDWLAGFNEDLINQYL
jgi:Spx/MgsR family transcriptional regulator